MIRIISQHLQHTTPSGVVCQSRPGVFYMLIITITRQMVSNSGGWASSAVVAVQRLIINPERCRSPSSPTEWCALWRSAAEWRALWRSATSAAVDKNYIAISPCRYINILSGPGSAGMVSCSKNDVLPYKSIRLYIITAELGATNISMAI